MKSQKEETPDAPNFYLGEKCFCGVDASHKIEESLLTEEDQKRHPLTQYVCQLHFEQYLMPYKRRETPEKPDLTSALQKMIDSTVEFLMKTGG